MIDFEATWSRVRDLPTDWYDRVGLTMLDGRVAEVRVSVSDMGRGGGRITIVPLAEEHLVLVPRK